MPELPEIETIRRGLEQTLKGHGVVRMEVYDRRLLTHAQEADLRRHLLNQSWDSLDRRGKYLLIRLANQYTLVVHLRMTGQLVLEQPASESPCRLRLSFDHGRCLAFRDPRRFGETVLLEPGRNLPALAALGPDPLNGLSREDFVRRVRCKTARIKPLLMDQHVLAGIGNIYSQEALFRARIRPTRPGCRITCREAERLYRVLRDTLQKAIDLRGTTSRNYRDAYGQPGDARSLHAVYRRGNQACLRCGGRLRAIRVGGRGTVYCPTCQH